MWPNPLETADLVTFTEEILNGKLHFFVQWHIWMTISEVEKVYFKSIKQALYYLVKCRYKDRIQTSLSCATSGNIQEDDQELTEFNHWRSTQSNSFCSYFFVKSILSCVTCTEADYYLSLVNRIKVFLIWCIKYITRYSWFASCNVTPLHLMYLYHITLRQFNANRE